MGDSFGQNYAVKRGAGGPSYAIGLMGKAINFDGVNYYLEVGDETFNIRSGGTDDAQKIAEKLTELPVFCDKVSYDQTTSYVETKLITEEESNRVNKISYIFTPVLNKLPMRYNQIVVQFDGNGLYAVKSSAPYSVKELESVSLKSKEDIVAEMYDDLKDDSIEFDNENLNYIIDKDGVVRLKYIYKDE